MITTALYELLHDRIAFEGVPPLTEKEHYVRGSAALLDAVGKTIMKINAIQKKTEEESRAGQVLFVIITDGCENAG